MTLVALIARRDRAFLIVRPAMMIGWYRRLVARQWTQPPTFPPGRPSIDSDLRSLIAWHERTGRGDSLDLLDQTIIWNERQLRLLLEEYIEHYNAHRPHRSLHQRALDDLGNVETIGQDQPIRQHATCGGLINEYRTAACTRNDGNQPGQQPRQSYRDRASTVGTHPAWENTNVMPLLLDQM